jgi:hypothetical protein
MNIDSMVEAWTDQLHDEYYRDDFEVLECDYCQEEKNIDSEEWTQSPFDKSINLCCEDCKDDFEHDYHLDQTEDCIAKSIFLAFSEPELRQKLGHEKCKGTFDHERVKNVSQDWNSRETIVSFDDLSKLHFSSESVSYSI